MLDSFPAKAKEYRIFRNPKLYQNPDVKRAIDFYWQRGYGMFSVSPPHLPDAEEYVRNQAEHHRKKTFQEEFREFLNRYGIKYDERYVWD
jgi:hypothetical protein